jgi:hypothetical protein
MLDPQDEIRISELERKIDLVVTDNFRLTAPEANRNEDESNERLGSQLTEVVWNNYTSYTSFFESLDSTEDSGASVASNRLFLTASGTSTVSSSRLRRIYQNLFSFDRESRFRTAFDVGGASLTTGTPMTDVEAYIGTGSKPDGAVGTSIFDVGLDFNDHYGFYIQNSNLYGITSDGTDYSTTLLRGNVNVYDLYFVEAVFFPNDRVDFYVSEPTSAISNTQIKFPSYKASLSTTLPSGARSPIYEFAVKNSSGGSGDKDLDVGFVEILQKK